ncbi:uncharacterized protein LOC111704471 [Eurytemora carolleeae]|uniref:uncharacterized protein LOC111704471 n=1 Tax=Eurytemora carolleeae TaxID=1294199 RepID=UPI000C77191A|nr:uncharacterized protein LOC111704471 [Eurytemora carolleeae]|eukprot:XP_023332479.1 uncharacterized protein LOC111704471 [Eurytemora affinis]
MKFSTIAMVPEIMITDENAPLFDLDWLNSTAEQINLADGKIDKFLTEINKTLAHRMRGEFTNKYRQQAVFELLGQDYTKVHFPHHEFAPELIRPPQFPPNKREELMAEMRTLLDEQITESLQELGYPTDISTYQDDTRYFQSSLGYFQSSLGYFQSSLGYFQSSLGYFQSSLGYFQSSLGYFQLQEFDRDGDDMYDTPDKSSIQGSRDGDDMYDTPDKPSIQGSGDGDDMSDTPDKSSIQGSGDGDDMLQEMVMICMILQINHLFRLQEMASGDGDDMYDTPDKPTKLKFRQSDVIGEALCAVIIRDTTARETLLESFREKCLMFPNPLRKFFWEGFIGESEEKDTGKKKSKKKAARDFKAEIKKKLKGGTQRAVQSSDYKNIYSAVIDTYHSNNILKTYSEDTHMLQTAHIINILNVVDKEYTNAQIYWALPFQILYEKGEETRENEEKQMIEISSFLEKFCRHAPLSFKDVSQVADKVLAELKVDEELYNGVVKPLDQSIHASGLLFSIVPEILIKEHPNKAEKTWNELKKKKKKEWKPKDHEHFGKLDLWIRKWISEGFVGVLPYPVIFYIWDVLFLYNWSEKAFIALSVMIFRLISPWFKNAKNNREVVDVLLEEPGKLYIQDIRSALLLLREEGCMNTGLVSLDVQKQLTLLNTNCEIMETAEEPTDKVGEPSAQEEGAEKEEGAEGEKEEKKEREEGEKKEEEVGGEDKKEDEDGEKKEEGEEKKEEEEDKEEDKGLVEQIVDAVF